MSPPRCSRVRARACGQHGVVLLITLIVMVILMLSGVALMRSFDTTLSTAGNLAFKRDLAQQSEQAAEAVIAQFRVGQPMYDRATRANNQSARNYSAMVLPSNSQGVPTDLLMNDSAFAAKYTAPDIDAGRQIQLRYVIDRQCATTGDEKTLGAAQCVLADTFVPSGGSASDPRRSELSSSGGVGGIAQPIVYRITVRATGPRDTQSFFQTTFSCCDS